MRGTACGPKPYDQRRHRHQERTWEISSLAGHLLRYARHLEGYDHELDYVNSLMQRMIEVIPEGHPRLKLKMLQFRLLVLQRIEALADRDLSATEAENGNDAALDLMDEIWPPEQIMEED